MALSKNTKFWASRIVVMAAVVAVAILFLSYVPDPGSDIDAFGASQAKPKANISDSVSRFYAEFGQVSSDPIKERFGEDTILLDEQNDIALGNAIENVSAKIYRPTENWEGDFKERPFAASSTLMQEAKAHALKEGFNLVWDLNQDFTIRTRYQSTATLVGMLEEIAGAVDSHFNRPIIVYFCSDKRALVITERESEYLEKNCQTTNSVLQAY
jgi:hypothetical protein